MMATPTTEIRLACMRASNECSSMPPPFRAASPHPPLYAFILHLPRDLLAARYWALHEACTSPPRLLGTPALSYVAFSVPLFPKSYSLNSRIRMFGVLRLVSSRYGGCVFEDLDIRSMQLRHCKNTRELMSYNDLQRFTMTVNPRITIL